MQELKVRIAIESDRSGWDRFAGENGGSVFISYGWGDVLEKTFGYKRYYLIAETDSIRAVYPTFVVKSILFEKKLSSLPMSDLGGPLGDGKAKQELLEDSQQILLDYDLKYAEVKCEVKEKDYQMGPKYSFFRLPLTTEEELNKRIGKKNRNLVRKSQKMGVVIEEANEACGIDTFYSLYLKTMKKHGTPPYPKKFYRNIKATLGENARLMLAKVGETPIAGALFLVFGDSVYYYSGVSDSRYLKYSPNTLLVYNTLLWGLNKGYTVFDFGRTQDEGTLRFKKSWGGECVKIPYSYKYIGGGGSPTIQKDRGFFASTWKTLVPLKLTEILGPPIRKRMGF